MKSIKLIFSTLLILILGLSLKAQLSGVYTINSASATAGSNYNSFTAFATAINGLGASGPVTVNVVANSGPYSEQVTLNQAPGVSATNSVLINGNGNTLYFSSNNSNQPWTLLLNGADYVSVNNMTVTGAGTYAYPVILSNGADNNRFNSLYINVPANSTTSNHIPVVFSGASSNYYTALNSGNNNTFTGCTLKSGYFSMVHYGLTGAPYNSGNTFSNCFFTDWYYYGVYSYYGKNLTITGCTIERPTHNTVGFGYGLYCYYNQGLMINANKIRNFWGGSPGNNNGSYPIYLYYNPLSGTGAHQNYIQNNIISDMNNNSYVYPIYSYYQNGYILNNTIILNNINNTYTGTFYGMYAYAGGASYPLDVKNNLVYLKMTGASTSYGIYYPTSSGLTSNNNNYYMANLSGTQYAAYYNGNQTTVANLISAGSDANSVEHDPFFLAPNSGNYMPTSYPLNNKGTAVGVTLDINGATRATPPDIGAIEFLNVPCSGLPSANSAVTPTISICPGTSVNLTFQNTYTLSGLTFQWQSATTGSAGPYAAVGGGTNQSINSPTLNTGTWYNAIVTCTNGGQTTTITPSQVQIAGTTTNNVPYFEGFEGLGPYNNLPNCSWLTTNSLICQTYTTSPGSYNRYAKTGNKFASFASNTNPNGDYFYTNGLQLYAGATYSMNISYLTDGSSGWNEFRVLYGASQSTTGLTSIASLTNNIVNTSYAALANTFTVASSGIYYIAVKCIGNGGANYLSWDDLIINAPCNLNPFAVAANSGSICSGQTFTINPTGANTYTFSSGTAVVSPTTTAYYSVSGTSSLGCLSNTPAISFITVAQLPVITASGANICSGASYVIQPSGANTYTFSGGSAAVTPTANTSYSVTGTALNGCVSASPAVVNVTVTANPVIVVNSGSICAGNLFTLTASGANTYTYSSGANVVNPLVTTSYSISGTSTLGCVSSTPAIATVTVNSLPVISVANGSVCSGNSYTLSPSGASSYTYSSGSPVVTPSASGYYLVSGTNSLGCVSATSAVAFISVISNPSILVSSSSICEGQSFTLQPSGADSYTYSGGSAVVNPTTSTSYSITGSSLAGCVAQSPAVATITVLASPVITANSGTICAGNSFVFNPSGATTYSYSGSTSATVTPSATSVYSVIGTSSLGCVSLVSANATVAVNALPNVNASNSSTTICAGETATITANGANSYLWNNSNTSAAIVVSPTLTTSYTVTGTDLNGCANTATVSQNVSECTSINQMAFNNQKPVFQIFPNPNNGKFTVVSDQDIKLSIVNELGQLIRNINLDENNQHQIVMDEVANGVYFIFGTNNNTVVKQKIIVSK